LEVALAPTPASPRPATVSLLVTKWLGAISPGAQNRSFTKSFGPPYPPVGSSGFQKHALVIISVQFCATVNDTHIPSISVKGRFYFLRTMRRIMNKRLSLQGPFLFRCKLSNIFMLKFYFNIGKMLPDKYNIKLLGKIFDKANVNCVKCNFTFKAYIHFQQ
jgi:hypothetical protein